MTWRLKLRGTQAKRARKLVYKDGDYRERSYFWLLDRPKDDPGAKQIQIVADELRWTYQKTKKSLTGGR